MLSVRIILMITCCLIVTMSLFLPEGLMLPLILASVALFTMLWAVPRCYDFIIMRQKRKLLKAKSAADDYLKQQMQRKQEQEQWLLESALESDLTITPGMLPKAKAEAIELLRCLVAEQYLSLKLYRSALGASSPDWHFELQQLIQNHWMPEMKEPLPLSESQCIQAMNSYLDYLIVQDQRDKDRKSYAAA